MLADLWFILITILWAGFFLLEGFDFGVGMLLPLVGRSEEERGTALRAIGPTWDGNEVWLLTAGGATFAAFPAWYASLFAGLYIPLALVLGGLIVRGVAIEYRGKVATSVARRWCDAGVVVGSLLPALLLGVAFADLVRGLKLDANHQVVGGFLDLVSPFGLLGGVATLGFFAYHGATFLALRTEGPVRRRSRALARVLGPIVIVVAAGFLVAAVAERSSPVSPYIAGVLAVVLVVSVVLTWAGHDARSFTASAVVALGLPAFVMASLWPDVLPARNNPAWSLTIHNASSSHTTLVVMTVVAIVFTPVVLAYQAWAYWVFRARVGGGPGPHLPRAAVTAHDAYQVPPTAAPGPGDGPPVPAGNGTEAPAAEPGPAGG